MEIAGFIFALGLITAVAVFLTWRSEDEPPSGTA